MYIYIYASNSLSANYSLVVSRGHHVGVSVGSAVNLASPTGTEHIAGSARVTSALDHTQEGVEASDTSKTKVVGHINEDTLSGSSEAVEVGDEGLSTVVSSSVVAVEEGLALGLGESFSGVTLGVKMSPADGSVTSGVSVVFRDVTFVLLNVVGTGSGSTANIIAA